MAAREVPVGACMIVSARGRDLAQILGVSERRIAQLTAQGMPKAGHGKYSLPDCVMWFNQRYGGTLRDRTLDEQRQLLLEEQTTKTRLDNETTKRDLLPVDEVTDVFKAVSVMLGSLLDALGRRMAIVLAAESDENEIERLLFEECRAIREQYSQGIGKLADAVEDSGGDIKAATKPRRKRVGRPGKISAAGVSRAGKVAK